MAVILIIGGLLGLAVGVVLASGENVLLGVTMILFSILDFAAAYWALTKDEDKPN